MAKNKDRLKNHIDTPREPVPVQDDWAAMVPREYLELSQQLDLGEIVRHTLRLAGEITGPGAQLSLLHREGAGRGFSVLEGQELSKDVLKSLEVLYPANQTACLHLNGDQSAPGSLPNPVLEPFPATLHPNLVYLPLGKPGSPASRFQGSLLILTPASLKTAQLDRLTQLAVMVGPALANAAEHQQVLNQYRMLETIRNTWDQLWITRDEQQRALEKMVAQNRALHDIGLAINSSLNLKEVLNTIVSETVSLTQASRGALAMWDETRRELTVMAENGLDVQEGAGQNVADLDRLVLTYPDQAIPPPVFQPEVHFPSGLSPRAISSLEQFLTGHWLIEPAHSGGILVCPLLWQRQVIGVIILNDLTPGRRFDREDENIVTLIGSQATIAIENARLFKAVTDERNRTRAILNSITDGVFTTDAAEHIITVNPGAQNLTGYQAEELVGRNYIQALKLSDRSGNQIVAEISPSLQAMKEKSPTEPRIFLIQRGRNNPGTALIALVAAPIMDEYGQLSGTVGVFRDVTQEQEVSRLKDEFVSLVSHELRTPMASVLGFSELMLTRQLSETKYRLYVETIHKEALRLSTLINDFLDIQRMEAGRQVYNYIEVDLTQLINQATNIFSQQHDRLKLDLRPDMPLVRADPDRILQTLTNLISNALKYSPDGGPVELSSRLDENGMLELEVRDYGLGIPREAQAHLFEKFYRVDNSDRREIGGTGLGLAISREIVEAHGGRIWLDSELGQGSRFYFNLPTVNKAGGMPEGLHRVPQDATPEGWALVVETNHTLSKLCAGKLEEAGLRAVCLPNVERASHYLTEPGEPPSLILLGLNHDRPLDSWDFMLQLGANPLYKTIPLVINVDRETQLGNQMFGQVSIISKPIDTGKLIEQVNRLTPPRPQRSLLVIDDDASLRRVLKETLSCQDFVVGLAASGEQALKMARQNRPDLIILDLMMPKMDGFDVLARLRSDPRTVGIPIIVASAKELTSQERLILLDGVAYFVNKCEYTPQRIGELIHKILQEKPKGK
jgi:PAS domain S-box-containing protein